MSALTFSTEPNNCTCRIYDPTDDIWAGHECNLLNEIYDQLCNYKIRHLNPRWFLTFLVTKFMSSSPLTRYGDPFSFEYALNIQDAYAPFIQEMVSVVDSQSGS